MINYLYKVQDKISNQMLSIQFNFKKFYIKKAQTTKITKNFLKLKKNFKCA